MVFEDNEIDDVRDEEERRGKRPRRKAMAEQRARVYSRMKRALHDCNEFEFQQAIAELGQTSGSDEYETSMNLFREYVSRHGRR